MYLQIGSVTLSLRRSTRLSLFVTCAGAGDKLLSCGAFIKHQYHPVGSVAVVAKDDDAADRGGVSWCS